MQVKTSVSQLRQYRSIKSEINELDAKIEGCKVQDVVRGSDREFPYTAHSVKLSGADIDDEQIRMYMSERKRLKRQLVHIEAFINAIPDSELRRIFRYRYIEGNRELSWKQIAFKLGVSGDGSTERKRHNRYLSEICQ